MLEKMEEKTQSSSPVPFHQDRIYTATERNKGKKVNIHYEKQLWGVVVFNSSLMFFESMVQVTKVLSLLSSKAG